MSVLFRCPRCRADLKAGEGLAGIVGRCPKCRGAVLFPGERTLTAEAEEALRASDRLAQRQTVGDRLRLRVAGPWMVSLALHAVIVTLLAFITWQAVSHPKDSLHKVNILLDLGEKEGGLRYRGPREVALEQPTTPQRDLLRDLLQERPRSDLIEVGAARGAPLLNLTDLQFDSAWRGGFATRFMELGARGERFVYIVDKSGSMWSENRLGIAKAELAASIEMLPYAAKFHVIFFAGDGEPLIEMPGEGLVNASRENKQRVVAAMTQVQAAGGTEPMRAFVKALELKPDIIFFLTDGQFAATTADRVSLKNREATKGKTTIHTIGFIDQSGEELLRRIARENHGSYRFIDRAATGRLDRSRRGVEP